jgi:hypothetical protein
MKKAAARAAKSPANGSRQPAPAAPAPRSSAFEDCYRRGFEHGAHLTFESAKQLFATESGRERLRQWVEVELRQWRLAAIERPAASPPLPPKR